MEISPFERLWREGNFPFSRKIMNFLSISRSTDPMENAATWEEEADAAVHHRLYQSYEVMVVGEEQDVLLSPKTGQTQTWTGSAKLVHVSSA